MADLAVLQQYTGVCHTDLHALKGDWPAPPKLPLVGGHEGAGRIVAIADNTSTTLKVGDAVGIKWLADSCLNCEVCREGQEATCGHSQTSGYSVDGSFQQYAVSYTRHLTPIPEGLPLEVAAPSESLFEHFSANAELTSLPFSPKVLCAGVTVWKAIKQSNTKPGDYILIAGAGGGLGHLAVQVGWLLLARPTLRLPLFLQYAAAMSLRVIAVDSGEEKKKLCASYGAEIFLDFSTFGLFLPRRAICQPLFICRGPRKLHRPRQGGHRRTWTSRRLFLHLMYLPARAHTLSLSFTGRPYDFFLRSRLQRGPRVPPPSRNPCGRRTSP